MAWWHRTYLRTGITLPYVFMAWYLVQHRQNFTLYGEVLAFRNINFVADATFANVTHRWKDR